MSQQPDYQVGHVWILAQQHLELALGIGQEQLESHRHHLQGVSLAVFPALVGR